MRLAIVGAGRMGAFHARTLATVESVEVVAVADADADVAQSVAAEIGATAATPDGLLDRDDIEAWLVATPTLTHGSVVRAALDAGLDVLCEKPLALDLDESRALQQLAADMDRILQIGFWRRYSPPWAIAKTLLDGGAIGRPLMVRLSQWDANPPPASFCDPAVSGGLAIDCGVHEFDLVEWLTGLAIERVTAHNLPLVDESIGAVGDVDNLLAVLELAGGAVATVDLTRNCRYDDDVRTEVLGEKGAIFVDLLPSGRTRLATSRGVEVVPGSGTSDAFATGVAAQAVAFARNVKGAMGDFPSAGASTRAVLVGRAVQQSAATATAMVIGA